MHGILVLLNALKSLMDLDNDVLTTLNIKSNISRKISLLQGWYVCNLIDTIQLAELNYLIDMLCLLIDICTNYSIVGF